MNVRYRSILSSRTGVQQLFLEVMYSTIKKIMLNIKILNLKYLLFVKI